MNITDPTTVAVLSVIALAISEILSLLPQTKSNGIIQLIGSALVSMFPKRRGDGRP